MSAPCSVKANGGFRRPPHPELDVAKCNFKSSNSFVEPETPGDARPPIAAVNAANIESSGGGTFTFTVEYTGNQAIDAATLGNQNLCVRGPNGFQQQPVFVGRAPSLDGSSSTSVYRVSAPGGTLLIINRINAGRTGVMRFVPTGVKVDPPFCDASGNHHLSALDALMVINYLNGDGVRSAGHRE